MKVYEYLGVGLFVGIICAFCGYFAGWIFQAWFEFFNMLAVQDPHIPATIIGSMVALFVLGWLSYTINAGDEDE